MKAASSLHTVRCLARAALIVGVSAVLLSPARAIQFSSGELTGSFDTTFSVGGLYRLDNPSPDYYGTSNTFNGIPGRQTSVNADDGNLNYGKGMVSELFKGSHDLELKWRNYGAFVRGYYFADAKTNDTLRTPLSDQAKDRVVRGAEFLDMYVRASFNTGSDFPFDIRIGRQVLSLGESTFIPNGVNVVNPIDLSKLRSPGSELKEALLPVNMVKASIGLTKNITIEPFWLLEFRRNELEPAGTYFSTSDIATRGGQKVLLGFGSLPDSGPLGVIPRNPDRDGHNFNQYGVDLHAVVPSVNDTDFGLYFVHYNSRSPVISAVTPTTPINPNLTGPLTTVFIKAGQDATTAAANAANIFGLIVLSQTNPSAMTPIQIATLQAPATQLAISNAKSIALLTAASTGRYFTEYPDGINMLGASFNTSLGKTGISWQGDVSYKHDQPLQVDDVELLFATLSSLTQPFGDNNQVGNYLGLLNREVSGYRRHDVWTAQSTLTKVFGPTLGAQQFTLLGEVGGVWADIPSKDTLRYEGSGTFAAGSMSEMVNTSNGAYGAAPASAFADKFSWGYQVLGKLEYSNVFAGVNIAPTVAFTHDVKGNTPLPLGNYIHDRKSVNVSVEFTYQNAWSLEIRYVNFFGAGRYNLLSDRDYVATTLKYSF